MAELDEAGLVAHIGAATLARLVRRPRFRPAFLLLAERDGATVGHAVLAHERRRLGAATLDVAALTLAADEPAPLLAAAVSAAAEAELPLLMLPTALPAAYAPFGLTPCTLHSAVSLPPVTANAGPPPALRAATGDDANDLAALANAAPLPLAPARVGPDWRWLLEAPEGWLVLEDKRGRAVGYAVLDADGAVTEAAAADAGVARQLVGGLGARGVRLLRLPLAHSVTRAALLLGASASTRTPLPAETTVLWGVVELDAALRQLAGELGQRLATSRYATWVGVIGLEGAAGETALVCDGGHVAVGAAGGPVAVRVSQISLSGATQLLLGYRAVADLRATGELRCADVDLGLLDTLFPVF